MLLCPGLAAKSVLQWMQNPELKAGDFLATTSAGSCLSWPAYCTSSYAERVYAVSGRFRCLLEGMDQSGGKGSLSLGNAHGMELC